MGFTIVDIYFVALHSMEGGELFQRIQDRQEGAFTERGLLKFYNYFITGTDRVFVE
jgi:hypothetical protein